MSFSKKKKSEMIRKENVLAVYNIFIEQICINNNNNHINKRKRKKDDKKHVNKVTKQHLTNIY